MEVVIVRVETGNAFKYYKKVGSLLEGNHQNGNAVDMEGSDMYTLDLVALTHTS